MDKQNTALTGMRLYDNMEDRVNEHMVPEIVSKRRRQLHHIKCNNMKKKTLIKVSKEPSDQRDFNSVTGFI